MPGKKYLPAFAAPLGAVTLSGAVTSLAFPDARLWPLVLAGLVPFLLVIQDKQPRAAFGWGFLFGVIHFIFMTYPLVTLMVDYGQLPLPASLPFYLICVTYLALYPAFFGLGLVFLRRRFGALPGKTAWILFGAALFTGLEYFKSLIFTGLKWAPLGAALVPSVRLIQFVDLIGPEGLTFLAVLVNLSLTGAILGWRQGDRRRVAAGLIIPALALGLAYGYSFYRLPQVRRAMAEAPQRKVAVVQGAIDQSVKWDAKSRVLTLRTYGDLTRQAAKANPWLIVWPETAAPFYYLHDQASTEWLHQVARLAGVPLLFGAPAFEERDGRDHYYNRAYLIAPPDRVIGHYDKEHLVPFGEYVPLKKYLPFLAKITDASGDYEPGEKNKALDLDGDRIGVLICFESVFQGLARRRVLDGAEFLVVITNDAWFGRTAAPFHHFDQAVLRAVENRRPVIRAANTGISGLIAPDGTVGETLGLFERNFLVGQVPRLDEKTVYTAIGDLFARGCLGAALLILCGAIIGRTKNAKRP
ncbi:MAG: apolipoprotein N-acyltransferase [Pseudomonadota bacterium]